jgi:hypothetical protein
MTLFEIILEVLRAGRRRWRPAVLPCAFAVSAGATWQDRSRRGW